LQEQLLSFSRYSGNTLLILLLLEVLALFDGNGVYETILALSASAKCCSRFNTHQEAKHKDTNVMRFSCRWRADSTNSRNPFRRPGSVADMSLETLQSVAPALAGRLTNKQVEA